MGPPLGPQEPALPHLDVTRLSVSPLKLTRTPTSRTTGEHLSF